MTSVGAGEAPYGLRELQVAPIDSDGNRGSWIDLPGQTMTVRVIASTAEQRANDRVIAQVTLLDKGEFELTAGVYSLEAMAVIFGATRTVTGSGAAQEIELAFSTEDDRAPFAVRGRVIGGKGPGASGVGGGDVVVMLPWCLATGNFEGTFQDQSFSSPAISGVALEHPTDGLMEITQRATAAALS